MKTEWNGVAADSGNTAGDHKGRSRGWWRGWEIAAMVLGFVFFWPVGLAILFWMMWNRHQGRAATIPAWVPRIGPRATTGNSAFEGWKQAELDRLEQERRKLAAAQDEFEAFLGQLKRAKDREEFDGFMAARGNPAAGGSPAAA